MEPDAIIIQDPTLLHQVDVFGGLKSSGHVLINTAHSFDKLGISDIISDRRLERMCTVPANELAIKYIGRPMPNAVLLGGFAALTRIIKLESVAAAVREKFSGKVAEGNIAAASAAYDFVKNKLQEGVHA
jgi:pyruvate ferredoxin oxidoreductase gamma subunit